jgi:preprotein translocase subunit Sec61beta
VLHDCSEPRLLMAKKKKGEGFHSAAGLIRYFDDEDERSIKINPYFVLAACIGVTVVVLVASYLWPT